MFVEFLSSGEATRLGYCTSLALEWVTSDILLNLCFMYPVIYV